VIAIASGLALLIGWYRGFTLRALELAGAAFVVVLAIQTLGLVFTSREAGTGYWVTVVLIAAGWVAAVFVGSVARRVLRP
jgi:ABC-type transport system involved in cytochrome c biogenesis permease subunit